MKYLPGKSRSGEKKSDEQFVQNKLKENDMIVSKKGNRLTRFLPSRPEPGDAPFYGLISAAYLYRFTPISPDFYRLTVTNLRNNPLQKEYFSFDIHLYQPLRRLATINARRLSSSDTSIDEQTVSPTEFTIWPEMLRELKRWRFWGEEHSAYAWEFFPTSVGYHCLVQHLASGEKYEMITTHGF